MNVDKRYYLKDRLFSYREYLNFSISERGLGKTTSAKMWCIDDFLKTGNRFVWVRRYQTELTGDKKAKVEGCIKTFFDKIRKFYPNHKLETKGSRAYIDGKDAGVFVSLAGSQKMKGTDFPDVNKIIFDEFIIIKTKGLTYLENEVIVFLDLVSTVFRPSEKTEEELKNQKIWLLANSITFANDYFYYFNVKPFKGRYYHDKQRGIVVEQCENEIYREGVRNSKFGKLVKGTTYEDYAIENKYLLDKYDFIGKKSPTAQFIFNVRYEGQRWGIYADMYNVYVTFKCEPNSQFYTFTKKDHSLDSILLKNVRNTQFDMLIINYQLGLVKCENIMIYNKFVDFMKLFIVK